MSAVALAIALVACGNETTADLELMAARQAIGVEAAEYVIPGTADLGVGNPCAQGDCAGAITRAVFVDGPWLRIDDVADPLGLAGAEQTITIDVAPIEALGGPVPDSGQFRIWGEDAAQLRRALDAGYELWVHACNDIHEYICRSLAFDDEGRVAGVGYGASRLVTPTLARASVGSASARAYLTDVMANGAPPGTPEWDAGPPPPPPEQLVPGLEEDPARTEGAVLVDIAIKTEVSDESGVVMCVRSSVAVGMCSAPQPLRAGSQHQVWMRDDPVVELVLSDEMAMFVANAPVIARLAVELPADATPGESVGVVFVEIDDMVDHPDQPFAGTVRIIDGCPHWSILCGETFETTLLAATLVDG